MDSRLNLSPYPPPGFVFQVIKFMTGYEPLHTTREVISHRDLLFVGQGEPESGIQILSGLIGHFCHGEI